MSIVSNNYPTLPRMTLTETRTPPTEQGLSEKELAVFIAAILAGHCMAAEPAGSPVAAIARLLRPLIGFPGAPGDFVADGVARLAVEGLPERPAASQSSGFTSLAYVDNLNFRARYAIAAKRRLTAPVAAERGVPLGERLEAAMTREARHFESHQDAMKRRVASVKMVEAAVERWGSVLGWRLGHPSEPRRSHKYADGQNFDTRRGMPMSTCGLPGALSGCTCVAGAPFDNATMLS
ncbi:MAG: hypothetical protein H0V83_01405 [Rubrobacter sp.]|nr:hypothetical protein [Rubrobacter sp.]